jgi:hypothetical protein
VLSIIKQLVDHYDEKIETLEKQIAANRQADLNMINTIESRSCVIPVPHEKRSKNSQKSLKQSVAVQNTYNSVQSKKHLNQNGTLEKTVSPLLDDIEHMLGLSEDTPQPNKPAPKQAVNPNKDRKASKLTVATKENVLPPLNRTFHSVSQGMPLPPRPTSAISVSKIKKRKPVGTV